MKYKFKIGDLVELDRNDDGGHDLIGKVHAVTPEEQFGGGGDLIHVRWHPKYCGGYREYELRLASYYDDFVDKIKDRLNG